MAQLCGSLTSNGISIKPEGETNGGIEWSNELDHLPLVTRQKLLMPRDKLNSTAPNINTAIKKEDAQCDTLVDCGAMDKCSQNATSCKEVAMEGDCDSHRSEVNENICSDQNSLGGSTSGSIGADAAPLEFNIYISNDFLDDLDHIVLKERCRMLLSRKVLRHNPILEEIPIELNSCDAHDNVPASTNSISGSTSLNLVKVKAEPLGNGLHDPGMNAVGNLSFNIVPVKSELDFSDEQGRDQVDHMQLQDRMMLQLPSENSKLNTSEHFECLRKVDPSSVENGSPALDASNSIKINRPRKRKKTATDSIETALEEDAPGLLQVLIEQGVTVDEIRLYGEPDHDEPIDESFIEDGFSQLETVISKIFFQRNSLLKFASLQCTKGSKPSYCLACLFSLIEQTRYLRFRNWPAEWGWCRDLQSFIFVFERHKRVVLERPEYGYATYFFELVESLPIDWQIKRLVTAMKITSCGRITLIENKTLVVGGDLTESEAQVLMHYGWTPNSGLGTMLNYCDRVVHDRKNEKDSSEWKSKIGKLLMDGYNGGSIVSSIVEAKVIQSGVGESPQIKMEL